MMRSFPADLHVHTCLSPCAEVEMSPRRVVAQALHNALQIIAVTDHNSARNAGATMRAAAGTNLTVLPGLEVCTAEEVHVLALFDDPAQAGALQELVYSGLHGVNAPGTFGMQVIADEFDVVEAFEEKLLIGAAEIGLEEMVRAIHRLGGLAIASHIDREAYGVIGHLGFIPPAVSFDALEISPAVGDAKAEERFSAYRGTPFVRNSDAHSPGDIGRGRTWYALGAPTAAEIGLALRGERGRCLLRSAC